MSLKGDRRLLNNVEGEDWSILQGSNMELAKLLLNIDIVERKI
jgi:hypothetical protein